MNTIIFVANICLILLAISVVFAFGRLLIGPTLPDRVIALDLLTTLGVGVIAVYAIATDQPIFLDVGVVVALIAFLGTVAFAILVERRTK